MPETRRPPKSVLALLLAIPALALIAAGCGGSDDEGGDQSSATATAESAETTASSAGQDQAEQIPDDGSSGTDDEPKGKGTTIRTADSQFGAVLFDDDQRAIYIFDKEKGSESECYDECAVEWPPVLTEGAPQAKGAVSDGKLGTTERDDGTTQVTYDGQPLYYYHNDPTGVVGCHNVSGFGGLWLALDASGNAV